MTNREPWRVSTKNGLDSKFRVSLRRQFGGKSISYIAVVELQKSGMAHLHVLVGVFISQRWISEAWQGVGGGRIVDIRSVDVHRVDRYISKYLTKDFFLSVPAKKKRISTSRDIRLFDKRRHEGWSWIRDSIVSHFYSVVHLGRVLDDVQRDEDGGIRRFTMSDEWGSPVELSKDFYPLKRHLWGWVH